MKLIIAGSRKYKLRAGDLGKLDALLEKHDIIEVVSGGCQGADYSGEQWGRYHKLRVKIFYPDWDEHGKAAGPIRNNEMAEYADAVALFPGGKGTESMYTAAVKHKLKIFDFRGIEKTSQKEVKNDRV